MKRTGKLLLTALVALSIAAVFYFSIYPKLAIVTGYNAKILCSCLFVSGMDREQAESEDLGFSLLWLSSNRVDSDNKRVRSSVLGMHPKEAIYRPGYGCTLLSGSTSAEPVGEKPNEGVEYAPSRWPDELVRGGPEMQKALLSAFDSTTEKSLLTRAVLVIRDGELMGEAYAPGFDRHSRLLGWSMTKSLTAALIGILVNQGELDLDDPVPVPEWSLDDRRNITWATALHMETGLHWDEEYSKVSPATTMLFSSADMGGYAASQLLDAPPGSSWEYSSGTTNILSKALRTKFSDMGAYHRFPYERLFGPLGASSFVLETDASGHFVGSSYAYATARDWGKLGQLFLDYGKVGDEVLLDSSFVEFCRTPNAHSEGVYGGHFWLNVHGENSGYRAADYWMSGFHGQRVSIHPLENTVIVRLGVTYDRGAFDFDGWTLRVLEALEKDAR